MAVARKFRLRRSLGVSTREKADLPTPETRAKLRRDTVRALYDAGRLDDAQLGAAPEIRAVLEAVGRGISRPAGSG